eukprot:TRINITY_DN32189_c0_g1_i1.p1 TRINITY_DN32189_c0_g1~~TRINITY_DN32189_c0_g1_i1.p1  ORF type:complete len:175 (-),score=40.00 TRINITY_DN32189_c0_g1_i1:323-847(-)
MARRQRSKCVPGVAVLHAALLCAAMLFCCYEHWGAAFSWPSKLLVSGQHSRASGRWLAIGRRSSKSEESNSFVEMQAEASSTLSATASGFLVGLALCLQSSPAQAGLLAEAGGGIVYEEYDTKKITYGRGAASSKSYGGLPKIDKAQLQRDKDEAQKRRVEKVAKDKADAASAN